jgi:methionyl-tRNA formyltransferase
MTLRLAFMGSPDFAVPALAEIIAAGHDVACVYTQPSRPAGRGKKDRPTPVHAFATAQGLPVRTPKSLKPEPEQAEFAGLELDIAVVVAYGLILPRPVLDAPSLGCINLHASLLPRWRGAAPIQRAIMAGDTETGVQVMQMEAGLDTGPVLMSESTPISADDTAGSLHDRLARLGADLLPRALAALARGSLKPRPQPEEGVTYAAKITGDDQRIDWSRRACEIDRQVRGLAPVPGAWFEWTPAGAEAPVRMKALMSTRTHLETGQAPGTVLDDRLAVATGEGAVRITRVQRPGKGPVAAEDFLRGTPIPPGTRLG